MNHNAKLLRIELVRQDESSGATKVPKALR